MCQLFARLQCLQKPLQLFYVPHLFVIENGEVIDQHVSLVDSYQGSGVDLTTAQHNELVGIYKDMIEELK